MLLTLKQIHMHTYNSDLSIFRYITMIIPPLEKWHTAIPIYLLSGKLAEIIPGIRKFLCLSQVFKTLIHDVYFTVTFILVYETKITHKYRSAGFLSIWWERAGIFIWCHYHIIYHKHYNPFWKLKKIIALWLTVRLPVTKELRLEIGSSNVRWIAPLGLLSISLMWFGHCMV